MASHTTRIWKTVVFAGAMLGCGAPAARPATPAPAAPAEPVQAPTKAAATPEQPTAQASSEPPPPPVLPDQPAIEPLQRPRGTENVDRPRGRGFVLS